MACPPQRYHWLISSVTEHLSSKNRDACLLWPFASFTNGYGAVGLDGRTQRVHKVSYEKFVSPLTDDKPKVLHSCDVRLCFNPLHLSAGTNADNSRDMVSKGRSARGELDVNAALTESDVMLIRSSYQGNPDGPSSLRGFAVRFGVHWTTIARVVRRETWAHI